MNQLFKKHRAKIFSGIVLGAIAAMAVVLLKNTSPLFSNNIDAANDYTIQLNSTNGAAGFSSSYSSSEQINDSSRTSKGNPIRLTYKNVKKTANKFAVMANGGYFYNPTGYQIIGLETINVTFTGGSLSLYSSKTNDFSGSPTSLTSGTQVPIKANYDYFKIVSTNETTIDNIVMTYTCAPRQEDVTDVITAADLAATATSYVDFTGVKKSSSAVYAGNSAKSSDGDIQLRSSNSNSGIVSTKSGGTVSSVKINIGSGTKTVDVYGSNTAYSSASDLYDDSKQGTLIGSVASIGTVNFTDSYEYVGIRSASGAVYLSSVEITWGEAGGGGDVPPGPETEIYSVTLQKSNTGLGTSASSSAHTTNLVLSDNKTSFSVVFDAGAYNMSRYDEFRIPSGKSLNSNCDVKVKYMTIDYYGGFDAVITADGVAVAKETSSTVISGHKNIYDYQINSSNWSITADSEYQITAYSITFYCEVEVGPVSVTGVSLDKTSLTLAEEASETLVATVLPSGATNKNVTWTSSNSTVASVDQNGKVTANEAGTATITVETQDGGFKANCEVTVTAVYHVTGVTLSKTQLNLNVGASETLTPTVSPSNATDKSVSWSSSNSSVASVSTSGTVTAVAAGSATITVKTNDGNKTATCTVTVSEVAVTSVTLSKTSTTLVRGGSETLTATVLPANATNNNITWSSSNSSVASVSNGTVTAVAVGSATITATSQADSNKKASCTVTVNPKGVISISLNKTELALNVDQSDTLTVTFNPTDADDQAITWSTSNSSIATVSNGTVTAKAVGSATITATSHDGNKTATCAVTVTEAPQETTYTFSDKSWSASPSNWTSGKDGAGFSSGRGVQITTGASGANATSPDSFTGVSEVVVTYCTNASSGAGTIAINVGNSAFDESKSVDKTSGSTLRTVSFTASGSFTGKVKITVTCTTNSVYIYSVTIRTANIAATDFSLPSTFEIAAGASGKTIGVTYVPAGANKNTSLTWTKVSGSSNITISSDGVISAKNAVSGNSAVVRATLDADTSKTHTCTINVVDVAKDDWTLLFYICGADLESADVDAGYGYKGGNISGCASDDIDEILAVKNQPSSVNIVLETGGATKWARTDLNSHKSKLARWEITNRSLNFLSESTYQGMGVSSTLQEFLEWGIETYPANHYGVFMWNHGGALDGCCFDEKDGDDPLTAREIESAVSGAKTNLGITENFDFIAYDACLMAVQDIAEINSHYFNYMICSQETEYAGGYDYDAWLPTLYSNPSTVTNETLLTKIASTFMDEQNSNAQSYNTKHGYEKGDEEYWPYNQTQSVLDLTKMAAYKSAFDTFATTINNTSTTWSNVKTAINSAQKYGYDDKYGYAYDIFDVKQALNALVNKYSSLSSTVATVSQKLDDMIVYEEHGADITGCGLNLFCPISGYYTKTSYSSTTNFNSWYSFLSKSGYGNWK
ncbi:MAG: Ig-like domain-containing protein [Bacilli bacterium]|nr:Ig-like domain-containing protein [Bacilli bacterium]